MVTAASKLIGFTLDEKQQINAARNAKMARLVIDQGVSVVAVSERFGVSRNVIERAVKDERENRAAEAQAA